MMDINEKTKPVGEIVLLKKLVPTLDKKYGDIFIPHTSDKNLSMGVAQIVDMGDKAKETTGLNIGDYVFYDYYSAFGNYPEYVVTKAENLIARLTEEEAKYYANNHLINK
jgi:co-chaperonin GroES (HSP10)